MTNTSFAPLRTVAIIGTVAILTALSYLMWVLPATGDAVVAASRRRCGASRWITETRGPKRGDQIARPVRFGGRCSRLPLKRHGSRHLLSSLAPCCGADWV